MSRGCGVVSWAEKGILTESMPLDCENEQSTNSNRGRSEQQSFFPGWMVPISSVPLVWCDHARRKFVVSQQSWGETSIAFPPVVPFP